MRTLAVSALGLVAAFLLGFISILWAEDSELGIADWHPLYRGCGDNGSPSWTLRAGGMVVARLASVAAAWSVGQGG